MLWRLRETPLLWSCVDWVHLQIKHSVFASLQFKHSVDCPNSHCNVKQHILSKFKAGFSRNLWNKTIDWSQKGFAIFFGDASVSVFGPCWITIGQFFSSQKVFFFLPFSFPSSSCFGKAGLRKHFLSISDVLFWLLTSGTKVRDATNFQFLPAKPYWEAVIYHAVLYILMKTVCQPWPFSLSWSPVPLQIDGWIENFSTTTDHHSKLAQPQKWEQSFEFRAC